MGVDSRGDRQIQRRVRQGDLQPPARMEAEPERPANRAERVSDGTTRSGTRICIGTRRAPMWGRYMSNGSVANSEKERDGVRSSGGNYAVMPKECVYEVPLRYRIALRDPATCPFRIACIAS